MTPAKLLFERLRKEKANKGDRAAIEMISELAARGREEDHYDFKQKAGSVGSGRRPVLHERDKAKLALALSAFANSNGGLLIYGVDDKSFALTPIDELKEFAQAISDTAYQLSAPPVGGLEFLSLDSADAPNTGHLVVYVPASDLAPHQVWSAVSQKGCFYYRVNAASEILPAHILEFMFGRRPHPRLGGSLKFESYSATAKDFLRSYWDIHLQLHLNIWNEGRASIRELYGQVTFQKERGGAKPIGRWQPPALKIVAPGELRNQDDDDKQTLSFHRNVTLPPGVADVNVATISISSSLELIPQASRSVNVAELLELMPPIRIDWEVGSDGAIPAQASELVDWTRFQERIQYKERILGR